MATPCSVTVVSSCFKPSLLDEAIVAVGRHDPLLNGFHADVLKLHGLCENVDTLCVVVDFVVYVGKVPGIGLRLYKKLVQLMRELRVAHRCPVCRWLQRDPTR